MLPSEFKKIPFFSSIINYRMNLLINQFFPFLFLLQFWPTSQENNLLKNVRNFAEEAVKGLDLVKLSNYFVDYAHLNGFVLINNDQFEEIADELAEDKKPIEGNAKELEKKRKRIEEKSEPKKRKQFKEVDKNQLSNHLTVTASSTLLPSPYPRELFELATALQPLMALLHFRASFDVPFLLKSTENTKKSDALVDGMVKIMTRVEQAKRRNPITLVMQRTDYLTDEAVNADGGRKISLKQIEATNSIGKGQGSGHLSGKMHQRILDKIKNSRHSPEWLNGAKVRENNVLKMQAETLYRAWKLFAQKYSAFDAIILLISVPKRKHYSHFDQLIWAQFKMEDLAWAQGDNPLVESITFEEMVNKLRVVEEKAGGHGGKTHLHLYYEGQGNRRARRRVAIAYFQDGFTPEHFSRPEEWAIREQMEMSTAIMSPSVYLHLMGSKTVQHELAKPGVMEKYFVNEPEMADLVAKLRGTFIEMWALGGMGKEGEGGDLEIVKRAMANPGGFVLKTNTDGGKGNYFEGEMVEKLGKNSMKKRSKFILQRRISPLRVKNALIPQPPKAEESIHFAEVDTEISIYGSLLAVAEENGENGNLRGQHEILFNNYDGYACRTKLSTNAQCNVSAGFGGADSLVLFPLERFENDKEQH